MKSARGRVGRSWVAWGLCVAAALTAVSCSGQRPAGEPSESAFPLLPVGAALPSGQDCAGRVVRGRPEEVPENAKANSVMPGPVVMPIWEDYTEDYNRRYASRVDGHFTGTTGEILQWGACKWGLDLDVLRAAAYQESDWKQSTTGDVSRKPGDCAGGAPAPCPTSFGILQLKHLDLAGSFPNSVTSTAFNVDYYGARIRGCFEGAVTYLGGDYAPGDLYSCVGYHWSGTWKDAGALNYLTRVRNYVGQKPWEDFNRS